MRKPEVVEMAAAPTAYNAGKIVARFGDTNVFSVISETPWELPIDALVLPVDIKGEPIGFPAENLKKFAAS
jgi:hypothetical protein